MQADIEGLKLWNGKVKFQNKKHFHVWLYAAAAAKSLQSCPTLCDPIDSSPLGSSVPGILQARKLEWVAISFSSAWKWKVKVKWLSRARLLATPWTAAYQAPPSLGFSRQEYWSEVPLPSPVTPEGNLLPRKYVTQNLIIHTKEKSPHFSSLWEDLFAGYQLSSKESC